MGLSQRDVCFSANVAVGGYVIEWPVLRELLSLTG
jgi:hypothetical protein